MPEKNTAFDLVIIGGGPGGYVAAIKAAQSGIKTALIETSKVGGTCLHKGCIPTKVLLHSADLYRKFCKAKDFGITVDTVGIHYPQFHRRKESVVHRLFQGTQFLLKKNGIEVIEGFGHLNSPHNVVIRKDGTDIDEITATNVILATGSVPFIPKGISCDKKFVLTSDDILRLEEIPASIVIAGGGAIGVEFAYLFNTLGSKVTIVELFDDIISAEDKEICVALKKIFMKRGIEVLTGSSLEDVTVDNGVVVKIKKKAQTSSESEANEESKILKADYLLLAMGRTPSLENLQSGDIALNIEGGYVQTNESMETSLKGLFAIGDITGPPLLAHKASNEAARAVSFIAGKDVTPLQYQNIPKVTYCFPHVASIGYTQEEAERKGFKIRIGKFPYIANSKAIIDGEYEDGFIKVIADEKYGEIVGVHAIGPDAGELMWGVSLATSLEGTITELSSAIFPHPTHSEVLQEAAHAVFGKPVQFYKPQ
ncbi:MAG: dihydrolipoyl dehydrogenase [Candidatus Brocadiaceae bacterium]|nr:dihydrolipoyl dehydrogenase [Candidatus Brocadiaceae bacterium]